jgi:hypothetical protein
MQLAHQMCLIPLIPQNARQNWQVPRQIDAVRPYGVGPWSHAREKSGTSWHAQGVVHVVTIKPDTLGCEAIEIRRADNRIAIAANVVLALLVRDDHQNVWSLYHQHMPFRPGHRTRFMPMACLSTRIKAIGGETEHRVLANTLPRG